MSNDLYLSPEQVKLFLKRLEDESPDMPDAKSALMTVPYTKALTKANPIRLAYHIDQGDKTRKWLPFPRHELNWDWVSQIDIHSEIYRPRCHGDRLYVISFVFSPEDWTLISLKVSHMFIWTNTKTAFWTAFSLPKKTHWSSDSYRKCYPNFSTFPHI